jgi:predicted N-acetyltransferase YhbS
MDNVILRAEEEGDGSDILFLYRRVFGENFPDMKRAANLLRSYGFAERGLSFVARDEGGELLGSVRYTKLECMCEGSFAWEDGFMLGPLSVRTDIRGLGLGRSLVERSLREVPRGIRVITIGDPGYFVPFGFSVLSFDHLRIRGEVRPLSVMEYGEGVAGGVVRGIRGSGEGENSDADIF